LHLRGVVQKIKKFAPRIDVNLINKLYGTENQVDKGPLAVPLATFLVAIRYVRFTSTPVVSVDFQRKPDG
jgi:hypothetical protein